MARPRWLVLVVGTESVGVLGALLAGAAGRPDILLFVALVACMVGLLPYVIVIGLVCCRWWFFRMASDQATPPSWINMGALATSTLACANIYVASPAGPAVAPLAWAVTLVGMGRFLLRPAVGSVLRRAAS